MRNNKNNITLSFKNIISFLNNLTAHFTGKEKIITLSLIILMLSFTNIILCFSNNSVSALSYQSEVGIGFTFNPTLSVTLSSSDLVISNLTPGSSSDSNSINVSVATNAAYGYTLSANINDENLVHSNNVDTFSSIDTNADLESLSVDNTWGYTSKLNNETIWNNYNGLSSSSNTILLDNNNTADSSGSVDFKIAAKAGNTQPSGEYTGTINFVAITKVAPMSLLDSFIASGAEQLNGYFKMQDMTHSICSNVDIEESELQLIDVRDSKIYWVAKLKDGNCWMTQNLDLDLSHEVALTSETSDIDPESYGTTIYTTETGYSKDKDTGVVAWLPERSTVAYNQLSDVTWKDSNITPYSYDRLNIDGGLVHPDSNIVNEHGLAGNYYNWTASLASNNSASAAGNPDNSICARGWRLPNVINKELNNLLLDYNIITTNSSAYVTDVNSMGAKPLYFVRGGYIYYGGQLKSSGTEGLYWSGTFRTETQAFFLYYNSTNAYTSYYNHMNYFWRHYGRSVRCLAR